MCTGWPRYDAVMGYSAWDAAQDAADAAREDEALSAASAAAESVSGRFSADLGGTALRPIASVRLRVGAEDQPVFVFELLVDLDDDLDADEYPIDEISRLQDELRARIGESTVDNWDWIVNTGTRTGATAG